MKHAVLVLALFCAVPAAAQIIPQPAPMPPGNTQPRAPAAMPMPAPVLAPSPATREYSRAMSAMMAGMDRPYTGDADRDFVVHMMPHHQGAIDMAEIELKYGHDAKLKQLAARIISAQQHEIAFMQTWLEKHPHR